MKVTSHNSIYRTSFGIQHNGISAHEADCQLEGMKGLNAYSYGYIPIAEELTGIEDFPTTTPLVPLGSTSVIKMFHKGKLPDNWIVFHNNATFDQTNYQQLLGTELLNHDSTTVSLQEALNYGKFDEDMFIKPALDLKMFAGVVVESGNTLQDALDDMQRETLDLTSSVIIAPRKKLYREFRVIVVDGVPTGFSQYKDTKGIVKAAVLNLADRDRLYFKTRTIDSHWRPADVYTIDFVEVGDSRQLKVVEYNCFNCSGLYKVDRNAVYTEIAKYVDSRYR